MTKVTDDVDQTAMLELPVAPEAASKLSDEPTETDGGLDFNFDVDLGEPASQENVLAAPVAAPLPDLDLSGISLDVGDGIAAGDAAATEEITLSASSESADVDTKLDLVTAYIDMGDQEGARELLQEVLKEGGPTQRDKAQKLLNGLG
jgi:pilus assembly protein FimV